jgi:hypothetical protein
MTPGGHSQSQRRVTLGKNDRRIEAGAEGIGERECPLQVS